jgi:chloramphenicol 3-O-phosphotransferase
MRHAVAAMAARGDRDIRLARWQYDRVHRNASYDLEIDTSVSSPLQCAKLILEMYGAQFTDGRNQILFCLGT